MYRVYVSPLVRFVSQALDRKQSELMNITTYAKVMLKKNGKIPWNVSMADYMLQKNKKG